MRTIQNDSNGIRNEAAFRAILARVHPVLGRLRRSISKNAALQMSFLSLHKCDEIEDLDFLKFFPNLSGFRISSKKLSNISGLRYLTQATWIDLSSDWPGSVDLSALSSCKQLQELTIERSFDADAKQARTVNARGWSALGELSKIEYLSLHDMGLADIHFLRHMTMLDDLELSQNPLNDLSPLQRHPTLRELDLSDCGLTDISHLATIPQLEIVYLTGNRIKDFSPLKEIKGLQEIYASDNGLSDDEIAKWENEFQHIQEVEFREETPAWREMQRRA